MASNFNLKKRNTLYLNLKDIEKRLDDKKNKLSLEEEINETGVIQSMPLINLKKNQIKQRKNSINMNMTTSFFKNIDQGMSRSTTQRFQSPNKNSKISTTEDRSHSKIIYKKKKILKSGNKSLLENKFQKSVSMVAQSTIQTVSDNFLQSFKVVFNDVIQMYFLHIYLKKKIKYSAAEVWNYILKMSGVQLNEKTANQYSVRMQTKIFAKAIKNIFKSQFKIVQIQQMIKRYFSKLEFTEFKNFQQFMAVQNDFMDFLVERSYQKKYGQLTSTKLLNMFFKVLIQLADIQKKLILVCKANQNQLIKFIMTISSGQWLKTQKLANFLQQNHHEVKTGSNYIEAKLTNYFDRILGHKHTKYEFMKWLKMTDSISQKLIN